MYVEMLNQFLKIADSEDSNVELFSQAVLDTMERTAALSGLVEGIGTASVNKLKTYNPNAGFAVMNNHKVLTGDQSIGSAVKDAIVPPEFGEAKDTMSEAINKDLQIPTELKTPINKVAFDTDSFAASPYALAGLGAGSSAGAYATYNWFDSHRDTDIARGAEIALEKFINSTAKETGKSLTKSRPATKLALKGVATVGSVVDAMTKNTNRNRELITDFSSINLKPSSPLRRLGLNLAIIGGIAAVEDQFGKKIYQGAKNIFTSPAPVAAPNLFEEEEDTDEEDDKEASSYLYNMIKLAGCTDDMLKEAISQDTQRLIASRLIKPALTTAAFMLPLALASRVVGRNLYGGLERIRPDDEINKPRIIIQESDIRKDTSPVITSDEVKKQEKKASLVPEVEEAVAHSTGKVESAKNRLRNYIADNPGGRIAKVDKLMQQSDYKGPHDLAHFVTEELPFKAVESFAYATPMIAAGVITGRNMKRGFEKLTDNPGGPNSQTLILEHGDKDPKHTYHQYRQQHKKASLDDISEVLDEFIFG